MAIAVPLVLAAAGASTGVIVGITVAAAVTGISAKIDKAATKVFGKDLVLAANLVGAAYMAWSGGAFGGGEAGGAAAAEAGAAGAAEAGAGAAAGTEAAAASGGVLDVGAAMNSAELAGTAASTQTAAPAAAVAARPAAAAADTANTAAAEAAKKAAADAAAKEAGKKVVTDGFASKVGQAWDALGDRGRAATIQIVGGVLQGAGQGKAEDEQREWESRYRSGSGIMIGSGGNAKFGPIVPTTWKRGG